MDEQRVELPNLPGLCRSPVSGTVATTSARPADTKDKFEGVGGGSTSTSATAVSGSRLNDGREVLGNELDDEEQRSQSSSKKSTVPDEDFFSLISRLQSGRMDDQRAKLKK